MEVLEVSRGLTGTGDYAKSELFKQKIIHE